MPRELMSITILTCANPSSVIQPLMWAVPIEFPVGVPPLVVPPDVVPPVVPLPCSKTCPSIWNGPLTKELVESGIRIESNVASSSRTSSFGLFLLILPLLFCAKLYEFVSTKGTPSTRVADEMASNPASATRRSGFVLCITMSLLCVDLRVMWR